MAHQVKCTICHQHFDRDKEEYVITAKSRYAHATCMLREAEKDPNYKKLEIIDPTDEVTCVYCKQTFHKSQTDYVMVSEGKFAHKSCSLIEETRELTDKEKLDRYINEIFQTSFVDPRIQAQIKRFMEEYDFSYSGILRTLKYFKEVRKQSFTLGSGIAIVPYIYKDAYNYYYSIWLAQEKNKDVEVNRYIPQVKNIKIPVPEARMKKRKLFTFLDEEVEDGE